MILSSESMAAKYDDFNANRNPLVGPNNVIVLMEEHSVSNELNSALKFAIQIARVRA